MFTANGTNPKQAALEYPDAVMVSIDRIQFLAWPSGEGLQRVPGFRVRRDTFVKSQTDIKTYARARTLEHTNTGTTIFVQYGRMAPWLAPAKLTVVPSDLFGLQRHEAERIARAFGKVRVNIVELAVDFAESMGVDHDFVRAHFRAGKSRPREHKFSGELRYGSRRSSKFVRCYPKKTERDPLTVFRVEAELRPRHLKSQAILCVTDLSNIPSALYPGHFCFLAIDWLRLEKYLARRGRSAAWILRVARLKSTSLHNVLAYLNDAGVANPHRFLRPLPINYELSRALRAWANTWRKGDSK